MENNYTKEQVKDITTREKKALEILQEMNVTPAAVIQKVKMNTSDGAEIFVDKIIPYLADTKYVLKSDGTYEEKIVATESTNDKEVA